MREYYIPSHVHFAVEGDAVVFMDLHADQYSLLLGERARAFLSLLSRPGYGYGTAKVLRDTSLGAWGALESDVVHELRECHLLTTETPSRGTLAPTYLPPPQETLLDTEENIENTLSGRNITRVLAACCVAKYRLSCLGIERTVEAIRSRRQRRKTDAPLPLSEARKHVLAYSRLRPLFPQDNVCLLDSIALLEFLAHFNLFPHLVFAVTLDPWGAHCWVQYDKVSFNEDAERARTYLPILVV